MVTSHMYAWVCVCIYSRNNKENQQQIDRKYINVQRFVVHNMQHAHHGLNDTLGNVWRVCKRYENAGANGWSIESYRTPYIHSKWVHYENNKLRTFPIRSCQRKVIPFHSWPHGSTIHDYNYWTRTRTMNNNIQAWVLGWAYYYSNPMTPYNKHNILGSIEWSEISWHIARPPMYSIFNIQDSSAYFFESVCYWNIWNIWVINNSHSMSFHRCICCMHLVQNKKKKEKRTHFDRLFTFSSQGSWFFCLAPCRNELN